MEGNRQVTRDIDYYNLDVIISVGYRVKSLRGTHYLKMTRRDILTTKGRVTHKQAIDKAHAEYEKYRKKQNELLSPVEHHFIESIKELEALE